jgi:hypothetical protein
MLIHLKVSARLLGFVALASKPTKEEIQEVMNCTRILTRIVPFVFELETYTFEEKVFWTKSEGAAEGTDDRVAPSLVKAVVQLLFYRGSVLNQELNPFMILIGMHPLIA